MVYNLLTAEQGTRGLPPAPRLRSAVYFAAFVGPISSEYGLLMRLVYGVFARASLQTEYLEVL